MQALPTLVMSLSMMTGMILWPILTRRHERAAKAEREQKRQTKYRAYIEDTRQKIEAERRSQSEILHENIVTLDDCVRRIRAREREPLGAHHEPQRLPQVPARHRRRRLRRRDQARAAQVHAGRRRPAGRHAGGGRGAQDAAQRPRGAVAARAAGRRRHRRPRRDQAAADGHHHAARRPAQLRRAQARASSTTRRRRTQWEFTSLAAAHVERRPVRPLRGDDTRRVGAALGGPGAGAGRSRGALQGRGRPADVSSPHYVVLALDKSARRQERLRRSHAAGRSRCRASTSVALYDELHQLPKECRAVVEVELGRRHDLRPGGHFRRLPRLPPGRRASTATRASWRSGWPTPNSTPLRARFVLPDVMTLPRAARRRQGRAPQRADALEGEQPGALARGAGRRRLATASRWCWTSTSSVTVRTA